MPIVSVEFRGVDELVRDLRVARKKAIPHAIRNGLNVAAFEGRKIWQGEIRQEFVNRNSFTARSVLVARAQGTNLDRMEAKVGSVADYMDEQEEGGTVRGRRSIKAIPGPAAAGQRPGSKRTKLVRSGFRLSDIQVKRAGRGKNLKQRNAIALSMASRHRTRFAMLRRPGGGKGLFFVKGGGQEWHRKHGWRARALVIRLMWDMSQRAVRVPPAPTLKRSLALLAPKLPHIHTASILDQLRRYRVLGY